VTSDELEKAKQELEKEYIGYYGKPKELVTIHDILEIGYFKQKKEYEMVEKALKEYEYPENLNEDNMLHFMYLRACYFLHVKPMGDFYGNAQICADVLCAGGGLIDMCKEGASVVYVSCLSHYNLNAEIQREIIDSHIPF